MVNSSLRYNLLITDPMQVPAVVYETLKRAKSAPIYLLMHHLEVPHINRGYAQAFTLNPGEHPNVEVKRPDAGDSWYHDRTQCFIRAYPLDAVPRNVREAQESWGNLIRTELDAAKAMPLGKTFWHNSDVFYANGSTSNPRHVAGTSGLYRRVNDQHVALQRACFYPADPTKNIAHLLEMDNIDPIDFQKGNLAVPGFADHLTTKYQLPQPTFATDYITDDSMNQARLLQLERNGQRPTSCVLGKNYTRQTKDDTQKGVLARYS